jgi:predicted aspartyl protease
MPEKGGAKAQAFTKRADGLVNKLLTNETYVSEAFELSLPFEQRPSQQEAIALWDTGATNTVISVDFAKSLCLEPTGEVEMVHAGSMSICNKFIVNITLPNQVNIAGVEVTEAPLSGFDMLIGMDIITLGDFSFTNKDGKSCFSFRIPSLECIDYVAELSSKDF